MTREDIIRMAREVGAIHIHGKPNEFAIVGNDLIKAFAALVAAASEAKEREACAKLADEQLMNTSALMSMPPKSSAAWNIATAIRERSANARARGQA